MPHLQRDTRGGLPRAGALVLRKQAPRGGARIGAAVRVAAAVRDVQKLNRVDSRRGLLSFFTTVVKKLNRLAGRWGC
jgi:hypothetical protein